MKVGDIRKLWRKHGGDQHGPRVETMTIPEEGFYDFVADLLKSADHYEEPSSE